MPSAMGGNVPQAKAFPITKVGEGAGVPLIMLALGGNTTHSKAHPLSLVAGEVQVGVPHPPSHDRLSYGWECSSSKSFPHHRSGGGGGVQSSIDNAGYGWEYYSFKSPPSQFSGRRGMAASNF